MGSDEPTGDDLDVELRWPAGDERDDAPLPAEPAPPQGAAPAEGSGGDVHALIDGLAASTAAWQSAVLGHIRDLEEQVRRSQAATVRAVREAREAQERLLAGMQASLDELHVVLTHADSTATAIGGRLDGLVEAARAPSGPAPQPVDLDPVMVRLDDLEDALARGGPSVDLQPVTSRLAGMEAALDELASGLPEEPAGAEVLGRLARIEAALAEPGPPPEALEELARQVEALRRRMALRARPLDEAAIQAIAGAVAARLGVQPAAARRRPQA